MRGWLLKKAPKKTTINPWRRRYFVYVPRLCALRYYEDSDMSTSTLLGTIELSRALTVRAVPDLASLSSVSMTISASISSMSSANLLSSSSHAEPAGGGRASSGGGSSASRARGGAGDEANEVDYEGLGLQIISLDRVWNLLAESSEDLQAWIELLSRVIPTVRVLDPVRPKLIADHAASNPAPQMSNTVAAASAFGSRAAARTISTSTSSTNMFGSPGGRGGADDDGSRELCSGWMWKQGGQKFTNWKRRYFVLYYGGLAYFTDETTKEFVGAADLSTGVNVIPIHSTESGVPEFGIDIVCMSKDESRVWHLCIDTEEERDQWLKALQRLVPTLTSETQPNFTGTFNKRGGRIKTWQTRYFVLLDGVLFYFSSESGWQQLLRDEEARARGERKRDSFSKAPSGVIPLRHARLELPQDADSSEIQLVIPTRSYLMRIPNAQERADWITALEQAIFFTPFQEGRTLAWKPEHNEDEFASPQVGRINTRGAEAAGTPTRGDRKHRDSDPSSRGGAPLERNASSASITSQFQFSRVESGDGDEAALLEGVQAELENLPPVPPHIHVYKKKLRASLRDATIRRYFKLYFTKVWARETTRPDDLIGTEYLDFWFAAEDYSQLGPTKYRAKRVLHMYDEFLRHGAERKIFIDSNLHEDIMIQLHRSLREAMSDQRNIFLHVQDQVLEMFAVDVFPYFLASRSQFCMRRASRERSLAIVLDLRLAELYDTIIKKPESAVPTARTAATLRSELFVPWLQWRVEHGSTEDAYAARVALNMTRLWRELNEFPKLERHIRCCRAQVIYETYMAIGAEFFVPVPVDAHLHIVQRLDTDEANTFHYLEQLIGYELQTEHVSAFRSSIKPTSLRPQTHHPMLTRAESGNRPTNAFMQHIRTSSEPAPIVIPEEGSGSDDGEAAVAAPCANPDGSASDMSVPREELLGLGFQRFLEEHDQIRYWHAWRDMQQLALFPMMPTEEDSNRVQRYADRIYQMYFGANAPRRLVLSHMFLDIHTIRQLYVHPARAMFVSVVARLEGYIRGTLYPAYTAVTPVHSYEQRLADRDPDIPPLIAADAERLQRAFQSQQHQISAAAPPTPAKPADADRRESEVPPPPPDSDRRETIPPPPPPMPGGRGSDVANRRQSTGTMMGPLQRAKMLSELEKLEEADKVDKAAPAAGDSDSDDDGDELTEEEKKLRQNVLPFSLVIGDPLLARHFRRYLNNGASLASLRFYFEVEEFYRFPMGGDLNATAIAQDMQTRILRHFVASDAALKIPAISEETRALVIEQASKTPRPYVFNAALAEVYEFLKDNFYEPFQLSKHYKACVEEYRRQVQAHHITGVNFHWSPERRDISASMDNLSCGNACWRMLFKLFLEKSFCAENYLAFVALDHMRYVQGPQYRRMRAQYVWDLFIDRSSPMQVNISSSLYKQTQANFAKCPRTLYNRVQAELFHLMDRDSLARFVESDEFKTYLRELLPSPTRGLAD